MKKIVSLLLILSLVSVVLLGCQPSQSDADTLTSETAGGDAADEQTIDEQTEISEELDDLDNLEEEDDIDATFEELEDINLE